MGCGLDPEDHRKAAGRAAEFRRIAAQRCVLRDARTAHAVGAAFLSRLLAACPRRAHSALGDRGGAGHYGGPVLGPRRDAAPARESELRWHWPKPSRAKLRGAARPLS